jgi:hypothetical protein
MSISAFIRATAIAAVGLADSRSSRPHQALKCGSLTRPGAKCLSVAPVPQLRSASATKRSIASGPSTDSRKLA